MVEVVLQTPANRRIPPVAGKETSAFWMATVSSVVSSHFAPKAETSVQGRPPPNAALPGIFSVWPERPQTEPIGQVFEYGRRVCIISSASESEIAPAGTRRTIGA